MELPAEIDREKSGGTGESSVETREIRRNTNKIVHCLGGNRGKFGGNRGNPTEHE